MGSALSIPAISGSLLLPWDRPTASWELCSAIGRGECPPRQGLRAKWPVPAPMSAVAFCVCVKPKQMECRLQVFKNIRLRGIKKMAGESLWTKPLSWSLFQTLCSLSGAWQLRLSLRFPSEPVSPFSCLGSMSNDIVVNHRIDE